MEAGIGRIAMRARLSDASSIEDVITQLKCAAAPITVGIDGFQGTRKSNLAYRLGYELCANVVTIDDYIPPNSGALWLSSIDYRRLSQRIETLRTVGFGRVVVEGICLLQILDKGGISLDYLIHTQGINKAGSWKYGNILNDMGEYERYLACCANDVEAEVLKYHRECRPWEKAGFIFLVRD